MTADLYCDCGRGGCIQCQPIHRDCLPPGPPDTLEDLDDDEIEIYSEVDSDTWRAILETSRDTVRVGK